MKLRMNFIYSLLFLNLIISQNVLDGYTIFTPQGGNPGADAETKLVINNLNDD